MVMKVQSIKPNLGYKQTEAGIIPNDWEVRKLSAITQFTNGKAHEKFIDDKGDYVVVNSKFVSTEGRVFKCSQKNLSPLFIGDIVMVMSDIPNGKALAKCFFVRENGKYTLNQRICSFRSYDLDNKYLFYKLNRNQYFLNFDSGVGQTNLKKDEVLDCPIALPISKTEQHAIATALSDVDALIASLDKLIIKKRDIKQATMQQLLTGKMRLPGFSGEWEVKKLGDIVEAIVGGGTPSRSKPKYWEGNIPWATVKDFATFNPRSTQENITEVGLQNSSSNLIKKGTIITSTRMALGKAVIYKVDVSINQDLKAIFLKKDINSLFVFYWFELNSKSIENLGSGSTVKGISLSDLRDILFLKPPTKSEQQAIATVLTDMDAEIAALEQRREKTRMLKQGMMQELLTGKTRLL